MTLPDRLGLYLVLNKSDSLNLIDLLECADWSRRIAGQDPAQRSAIVVRTVSDEIAAVFGVHGLLQCRGQGGVTFLPAALHGRVTTPSLPSGS